VSTESQFAACMAHYRAARVAASEGALPPTAAQHHESTIS
jgi:hypothetical protein